MAKRSAQDIAAAKAKKQKMILVVGGVLLLGLAALQGPKLMKDGASTASPPPVAAPSATGTPAAAATVAPPGQGLRRRRGRCPAARLGCQGRDGPACVVHALRGQGSVRPAGGRRVGHGGHSDTPGRSGPDKTGTSTSPSGTIGSAPTGTGTTPAAPPAAVTFATIDFNTKPQQVEVKGTFPTPEPLFVLRSLTKKQAKIAVAGGSFDGGKPVTLKLGKRVTLVNTATGVRYVLKLVYTGTQPEVIEGFTTAANKSPATTTTAK